MKEVLAGPIPLPYPTSTPGSKFTGACSHWKLSPDMERKDGVALPDRHRQEITAKPDTGG